MAGESRILKQLIIKWALSIAQALNPILVRILPISVLRKIKKKMVHSYGLGGQKTLTSFNRKAHPDGINLIGNIQGEIGLGQSCRLVASALSECAFPFTVYNYIPVNSIRNSDHTWDHKITGNNPYNINLIHINPYDLMVAHCQMPEDIWKDRYNIGFWLWELEDFPEEWTACFNLVHEIWTPAEFVSESIRRKTNLPVHTIPYPIEAPYDLTYSREYFHLPVEQFLFLSMYDCNSTMARKNPMGVLNAFKQAFSPEDNVGLVIKINNPQKSDLMIIQEALTGYNNIYIISDILSKMQVNSLIRCVDVFVSLHRSEGFGLVPAEAMLLGTPVIATNWSSTTEFMTKETACLIDFTFINVGSGCEPYPADSRWAEPDIHHAAQEMRRLYTDPVFHQTIAVAAQTYIKDVLGMQRAVEIVNRRVGEIYEQFGR